MKIKILYNKTKPEVTERMKEYAEFTYQKVNLDTFPTIKQKDGDIVIDYAYLFDFIKDEDGVMAVVEGDKLKGVFGTHIEYRGKQIIQAEDYPNKFRKWTQNKLTRLWSLVLARTGDYKATQYTMEHELGHALCNFYGKTDDLHTFIKLKKYDDWWATKDFPKLNWETDTLEIAWGHGKSGPAITPKCYILHTDLGTERGTRETIYGTRSVSYNYYVTKDGRVIDYVPAGFTAWHAGVVSNPTPEAKKFFGNKNPNSMSIGICFEGRGEDANPIQEQKIRELISEHGVMPIFAHKEITDYKPQAPLNLKRKLNNIETIEDVRWWYKLLAKYF